MCAATDRWVNERWVADAGLSPDVVCDLTRPSHRRLAAIPQAPREARIFLADRVCPLHTRPATIETATLLVSELVTNAVRHAAPPLSLTIGCARAWLVVEVMDGSLTPPRRADGLRAAGARARIGPGAVPLDEGGRGIPLVEALSSEWGSRPVPGGKVTWFRLAL